MIILPCMSSILKPSPCTVNFTALKRRYCGSWHLAQCEPAVNHSPSTTWPQCSLWYRRLHNSTWPSTHPLWYLRACTPLVQVPLAPQIPIHIYSQQNIEEVWGKVWCSTRILSWSPLIHPLCKQAAHNNGTSPTWGPCICRWHTAVHLLQRQLRWGAINSSGEHAKMYCSIRDWMLSDRLKLDGDKTKFIIIGEQLAKVNIDSLPISDSTTTPVSEVKNLGTWFDRQLKMETHIKNISIICKASFFHLYNKGRIWKFLSLDCAHILLSVFVTSHLDYLFIILF